MQMLTALLLAWLAVSSIGVATAEEPAVQEAAEAATVTPPVVSFAKMSEAISEINKELPEGRLEEPFTSKAVFHVRFHVEKTDALLGGIRIGSATPLALYARLDQPGDPRFTAFVVGELAKDLRRLSLSDEHFLDRTVNVSGRLTVSPGRRKGAPPSYQLFVDSLKDLRVE